jgi:RNA polymerase sigma-70 factor (ECF subfamily)
MAGPEEKLLDQAVGGDAEALSELLRRFGPKVRRQLEGKISGQWRPVLDVDDVMQVTYLEAFLRIDRFVPGSPESFSAWLTRIAENNVRDAIKALERAKRPPPDKRVEPRRVNDSYVDLLQQLAGTTTPPSGKVARHEVRDALDSALDNLPEHYAKVVRLYDLEGCSASEVAGSMGRSVGAVHMLRVRAHDHLRELLGSGSRFFSDKA